MIREILEIDSGALSEIHQRCFEERWSEESFRHMLLQRCFSGLVDEDGTVVRGFILANIVLDEAEIIAFCVLPEFRNRSIGRSLLDELIKRFVKKHVKKMFLEVAKDNHEAIWLYKSMGCKELSQRLNYYRCKRGTKDAIVLFRSL
ncbi:MAG: ribosomal protein S18-alanine N-acetyltransferase [Holosporaceae bacterium]|jgi:ribosomal-protein-alanine N-acetyltransferase|nr:ribosomal protein S18-alanine N-acetyltransferase [Holosporaceae bacterium]